MIEIMIEMLTVAANTEANIIAKSVLDLSSAVGRASSLSVTNDLLTKKVTYFLHTGN